MIAADRRGVNLHGPVYNPLNTQGRSVRVSVVLLQGGGYDKTD